MKTYLVKFKPLEPYFFGNEKNFVFPKEEGVSGNSNPTSYYIRSENGPSQSAILGALRYILLPHKKNDWNYTQQEWEANNRIVGKKGFDPTEDNPDYGVIESISPVFLYNNSKKEVNEAIYVTLPFDCKSKEYDTFTEYKTINTVKGKKYYTDEYDAKKGIESGYVRLDKKEVLYTDEIFAKSTRVGINRSANEKGFFKKEYVSLKEEYSFAVYMTIKEDEICPEDNTVFMGQGKSTFAVSFIETDENPIETGVKKIINDNIVYCLSDCFVDSSVYDMCYFAITKTKTYRMYTKKSRTVNKGSKLYRLVTAGSIFIPRDKDEFLNEVRKKHLSKIGYNVFVSK